MKHEINSNWVEGTIDPTELEEWQDVSPAKLINLGGLVTGWFLDYVHEQHLGNEDLKPLLEYMSDRYSFGVHPMEGGTIDGDLIHHYPEDPQMHPAFYLKSKAGGAEMVGYQHAIFAFRAQPEDEWYLTRMD